MRIHATLSSFVSTTALAMTMALVGACDDDQDRGRPMSADDDGEPADDGGEPADDDGEPADDDGSSEVPPRAVDEPLS